MRCNITYGPAQLVLHTCLQMQQFNKSLHQFRIFYGSIYHSPEFFSPSSVSRSHPWIRSSDTCWDPAEQSKLRIKADWRRSAPLFRCCPAPHRQQMSLFNDECALKRRDDEFGARKERLRNIHHQARKWREFLKREDKQTSFKNTVTESTGMPFIGFPDEVCFGTNKQPAELKKKKKIPIDLGITILCYRYQTKIRISSCCAWKNHKK